MMQAATDDIAEAEDRGLSRGEIGARETFWNHLRAHFGTSETLAAVTKKAVIAYEGARRRSGVRGQTIRKEIACLKRAFDRAADAGIDVRAPVRWPIIRSDPPDESRRGKLVPANVFGAWVRELPPHLRDEFRVASLTGLREGEIHRFDRTWILRTREGWMIRVPAHGAKNRKERLVALPDEAREILDGYDKPGPFFPRERWQGRYWLRRAARELGLDRNGVTLRDLRSTYSTLGLEPTAPRRSAAAPAGVPPRSASAVIT